MHYRQRIRDAVAAALTAANTGAGANVFTSRARPILEILQKRESVLSVYTADESAQRGPDGYLSTRTLTVSIEGMAGGGDDLDDILDDLALQVETAIDADRTLGGLLHDELVLESTGSEITARGNQQVGAFRMDFECTYLAERDQSAIEEALWPERPLPTEVFVTPVPTPAAYRSTLEKPDSTAIESALSVACEDGSCSVPAYGGDFSDNKLVIPQ
jgi:hypothetical protein